MDLDRSRTPMACACWLEPARFVVSWVAVPAYQDFGFGQSQTFQIRLYPDGRIEFAYGGVTTDSAVVGISPGGLQGATTVVSFATGVSGEYSSTVAERFGRTQEVDLASAAQKFYQTHDDAYDYLVIYNNLGIGLAPARWPVNSRSATIAPDTATRWSTWAGSSVRQAVCRP